MTLWTGHDVAVTLGWQDCIVKCQTGLVRDQGLDIVMTFVNCSSGALLQIMIPSREFRNVRGCLNNFKAAYSVTMNIFRKKKYFLFKSFVKVE